MKLTGFQISITEWRTKEFLAKAQESLTPEEFTEIIEIVRNMTFEQVVEEILNF
jgi:hypothetical protein